MEEQRKEEEMRQREFCICRSFSGTLFLGENVAPANGFVMFQEKWKTVEHDGLANDSRPSFEVHKRFGPHLAVSVLIPGALRGALGREF